jgi:hypothetical protein
MFSQASQEWVKKGISRWIGITSSFAFLCSNSLSFSFALELSTIV